MRRCGALTGGFVDVTPTLDGFDVAVHRVEVGTHRHDGYVAPPSFAPRRDIARPLVVPAIVLLDRLEAECIGIPSKLEQFSRDPRLDLDRLGLRPARKQEALPDPGPRSNAASLKPSSLFPLGFEENSTPRGFKVLNSSSKTFGNSWLGTWNSEAFAKTPSKRLSGNCIARKS